MSAFFTPTPPPTSHPWVDQITLVLPLKMREGLEVVVRAAKDLGGRRAGPGAGARRSLEQGTTETHPSMSLPHLPGGEGLLTQECLW